MLRLEWTTPAADELEAVQTYYHELNPLAARTLARRIVEAALRPDQVLPTEARGPALNRCPLCP